MHVLSVQTGISRPSTVANAGATAIVKDPVGSAVVTAAGLEGDVIVDLKNHGGPDQAVYVYTQDDYDWWEQELGERFAPGFFGENVTFSNSSDSGGSDSSGSDSSGAEFAAEDVRIGDRYQIGEVLLEVTAPRIPCGIFADRVGRPDFVKRFRDANRPGMYCRVLTPGAIGDGDIIEVTKASEANLGLVAAYKLYYNRNADIEYVRRAITSPVSARFRDDYERRLARHSD